MVRASFFTRIPLRQLLVRAFASALLCGAAASAQAAVLTIGGVPQSAAIAGRSYTWKPWVTNPSGRTLTFGIANKPSWATLNTRTGQLSGTLPNIIKTYTNISISVTDGVTTAKTGYFSIRVYPPKTTDKPVISGTPATSVTAGSPYTFQPSARDVYGQPLSFSVKNKPAWASFSIATGRLSGTPTGAQAGSYGNIAISVSNGQLAAALPAFSIQVKGTTSSTPSPTVSLSASPGSVSKGAASMLSWSSTNVTSCTASGGWSGTMTTSGSKSTGALTSSKAYTLACSGSGGSVSRSVTVNVTTPVVVSGGASCSATSGGLVLRAKAVRSSGISPVLMFFDATGTSSTAVSGGHSAFQDVSYSWRFGDTGVSGSGTWAHGSNTGHNSKNSATGAVAAHLYVTSSDSTYPVTVTAYDGTNNASCQLGVSAYAASGANGFPGSQTTCVYNTS